MAGKRHHYVPQFLQKAFASHVVSEEFFTWVYRKGSNVFNSNIKNVGVEGYFYSKNGDLGLDEAITEAEGGFSRLVNRLRKRNEVGAGDCEQVAQLFSHLEARTRHLRESFLLTGKYIVNEFMDLLSNPALCESYFSRKLRNDPSIIRDSVSKELSKRGLPQNMLPILIKKSEAMLKQVMPTMVDQLGEMAVYLREVMPDKLKEAAKSGHIRALTDNIAPDVKVQRLNSLVYKIEENTASCLPLGDSIVLFEVCDERTYKPFIENKDDMIAAILPISPQQVLVGSEKNYKVDFSALPHSIASCSIEYFISSESSLENERLCDCISKNAHLLSKSQLEGLIDKIINE